ncbi:DUF4383 domain-containing protein [Glycomyces tarimensis]
MSGTSDRATDPGFHTMRGRVTPVQDAAVLVALGFVVVGVLGFLPGVTTNFDEMAFAGHESEAKLLGIFQVSVLHNIVHIVIGLVGAFMSWFLRGALIYLTVGGIAYLLLGVYGLFVAAEDAANFLPMNTADDLLHFAFAIVMLGLLFTMRRTPTKHSSGGGKPRPEAEEE